VNRKFVLGVITVVAAGCFGLARVETQRRVPADRTDVEAASDAWTDILKRPAAPANKDANGSIVAKGRSARVITPTGRPLSDPLIFSDARRGVTRPA